MRGCCAPLAHGDVQPPDPPSHRAAPGHDGVSAGCRGPPAVQVLLPAPSPSHQCQTLRKSPFPSFWSLPGVWDPQSPRPTSEPRTQLSRTVTQGDHRNTVMPAPSASLSLPRGPHRPHAPPSRSLRVCVRLECAVSPGQCSRKIEGRAGLRRRPSFRGPAPPGCGALATPRLPRASVFLLCEVRRPATPLGARGCPRLWAGDCPWAPSSGSSLTLRPELGYEVTFL